MKLMCLCGGDAPNAGGDAPYGGEATNAGGEPPMLPQLLAARPQMLERPKCWRQTTGHSQSRRVSDSEAGLSAEQQLLQVFRTETQHGHGYVHGQGQMARLSVQAPFSDNMADARQPRNGTYKIAGRDCWRRLLFVDIWPEDGSGPHRVVRDLDEVLPAFPLSLPTARSSRRRCCSAHAAGVRVPFPAARGRRRARSA